ncbi:MAG TPA: helix-turn-helix domain-containing protein [Polyangiaceae bacterium]|jgi:DNA-binding protein Fis|nr:helix-turn-helix domain-containing protein [Polyangiaceae bacterium]
MEAHRIESNDGLNVVRQGRQQATSSLTAEQPTLELQAMAASLVGRAGIDVVQERIRRSMLVAALEHTNGNLSRAAQLLGVKRQAVQQMLIRYEMRSWVASMRHMHLAVREVASAS